MTFFCKLTLALCVFAGMATASLCEYVHLTSEVCADAHPHDHHNDHHHHDGHHPQPDDCGDHDGTPHHHHHCLQLPVADRPTLDRYALATFQGDLMKISVETSLIPDEPFFSLDKPPLI